MSETDRTRRGFTLIELLVVIAVIGLLSSVVLASLNNARKKGRDARRMQDMRQLQAAFELYHAANGMYPANPGGSICSTCVEDGWNSGADLAAYIPSLPIDPLYDGTTNGYRYRYSDIDGRQSYTMLMRLESNASWCSISSYPGHSAWNGSTAPSYNYAPCY